ncbi:hypothetical protein SRRS_37250 [Sporomusa rhizae]|uniref:hypothetical protein n=1 Tax=Sporomusa rhizae TaxID=357999 RepID=UPI00352A65F1
MLDKKNSSKLMNEATDNAANSLEGVSNQNSDAVTEQFNNKIDEALEQAKAKYAKNTK